MKGHEGHVSALALGMLIANTWILRRPDPSGSRLLTGGYDSVIKFWDFNAMDSNFKSFRTISPETDIITHLNYSPTGDRFIMVSDLCALCALTMRDRTRRRRACSIARGKKSHSFQKAIPTWPTWQPRRATSLSWLYASSSGLFSLFSLHIFTLLRRRPWLLLQWIALYEYGIWKISRNIKKSLNWETRYEWLWLPELIVLLLARRGEVWRECVQHRPSRPSHRGSLHWWLAAIVSFCMILVEYSSL